MFIASVALPKNGSGTPIPHGHLALSMVLKNGSLMKHSNPVGWQILHQLGLDACVKVLYPVPERLSILRSKRKPVHQTTTG